MRLGDMDESLVLPVERVFRFGCDHVDLVGDIGLTPGIAGFGYYVRDESVGASRRAFKRDCLHSGV